MKSKLNFIEQLKNAASIYKSIMSFGLDPVISALPKTYQSAGIHGFLLMLTELFAYMKEQKVYPGAFKPNYGFYSKYGNARQHNFKGLIVLGSVMNLIEKEFPGILDILDFKRGDIGKSSDNYSIEGFEVFNADAVTIAPYMGEDSMLPFADWCDHQIKREENRGVYALNLTSNPGARDFEMKELKNGKPLFMEVSEWIRNNAGKYPGLGAVVGAPNLKGLADIASFYRDTDADIPLLIPGVGGQGGKADEVANTLNAVGYDMKIVRINVSSGLTHPWGETTAPDDWKKIIVDKLFEYNKLTGMV